MILRTIALQYYAAKREIQPNQVIKQIPHEEDKDMIKNHQPLAIRIRNLIAVILAVFTALLVPVVSFANSDSDVITKYGTTVSVTYGTEVINSHKATSSMSVNVISGIVPPLFEGSIAVYAYSSNDYYIGCSDSTIHKESVSSFSTSQSYQNFNYTYAYSYGGFELSDFGAWEISSDGINHF